jgi:two-component system, cell cycle sensor histidine kinase and response regulator CckA
VERMGKSIHLVLTDMIMPKMRGLELGQRLRTQMPNVKVAYMTGYLEQNAENDELLGDAFFLQKPFSREAVVNLVKSALEVEQSAGRKRSPEAGASPKATQLVV